MRLQEREKEAKVFFVQSKKSFLPKKKSPKRAKTQSCSINDLLNLMASDPDPAMRAYAASSLEGYAKRKQLGEAEQLKAIKALQSSLFELSRSVRITASQSLAEIKGWR